MIEVKIRDGSKEAVEKGLKALKKICMKDGVLKEAQERRYYKKPSQVKREKKMEQKRKHQIELKKQLKYEDK
jgi:small subunit ribosomal protein S21